MTLVIIIFFFIVLLIGFIVIRKKYLASVNKHLFANEFRNTYVDFVNIFSRTANYRGRDGEIDHDKYVWLTKNSNKMQIILGQTGVVHYTAPFGKFVAPNYQIILNTIPKFRQYITEADINLVDDALLRFLGLIEERSEKYRKQLKNPIIWLQQGFKEIFSLPIYIVNWFGIIPDRTVSKITSNIIFKIITGIGGLVTFISGLVTILTGKEAVVDFLKKLFGK